MIKVVKIGGNVVDDPEALDAFCRDFASMTGAKVLVHGGGVMASELQKQLGQTPLKIEGRRVTDKETLNAVTMVYSGLCNKSIVALLQKYGCNAIGLSGCDADVIRASKRAPKTLSDGITKVDYGFVGDVKPSSVNVSAVKKLLDCGFVPVFCAINHDGKGQLLNTNADTVAASVASALGAELQYCFELEGVLADRNDPSSVIKMIDETTFNGMKADGTVSDGMIPKIENCMDALRGGACSAVIKSSAALLEEKGTNICL